MLPFCPGHDNTRALQIVQTRNYYTTSTTVVPPVPSHNSNSTTVSHALHDSAPLLFFFASSSHLPSSDSSSSSSLTSPRSCKPTVLELAALLCLVSSSSSPLQSLTCTALVHSIPLYSLPLQLLCECSNTHLAKSSLDGCCSTPSQPLLARYQVVTQQPIRMEGRYYSGNSTDDHCGVLALSRTE